MGTRDRGPGTRDQGPETGDRGPGTGKSRNHKKLPADADITDESGNSETLFNSRTLPVPGPWSPVPASHSPVPGCLYIVATPIGNLEDITFRAVRTLKEVDLIAAEDTRHSRKLLSHFGISKPITSYFDHNQHLKGDYLLNKLREGTTIALITDAGTPCIADPGYQLVRDAIQSGIKVIPIPGPSAAITALSAAGLPTDRFVFEGFLPSKAGKRIERLRQLSSDRRVLVFYEAPHRLAATLADMLSVMGDRFAVVARELTKLHEEFRTANVSQLAAYYSATPPKGEVVILISPSVEDDNTDSPDAVDLLKKYLSDGNTSLKDAVKRVAVETGNPRSEIYDLALGLRESIK